MQYLSVQNSHSPYQVYQTISMYLVDVRNFYIQDGMNLAL